MRLDIQLFAKKITTTITESAVGDSVANTSNVKVKAYFKSGSDETHFSSKTLKIYLQRIEPDNTKTQVGSWSGSVSLSAGSSVTKEVEFKDIQHQEDGTLKVRAYFYIATGTSGLGTITESDTAVEKTLTTIARASDFNNFSIRINRNSSITIQHTITKKNTNFVDVLTFCGSNFTISNNASSTTISRDTSAYEVFYSLMGNSLENNYTASLQTYSGNNPVGNATTRTAIASLNNLDGDTNKIYGIDVALNNTSDGNADNYITSKNADGSTYTSSHKVSEFTTTDTFLQNWSNPKFTYVVEGYYTYNGSTWVNNYTYGNPIRLSGISTNAVELTGSTVTQTTNGLGTSFEGGTYKLNGTDGRKSIPERSKTITRKSWIKPTINLTLTRRSSTSQYIDWELDYSYTNVSRTGGNLTPTLNASYTYNGVTTTLVNNQNISSNTSGNLSGTITLTNADDYKYPISAVATIIDMIDYKEHSTLNLPSGQPAIYVHKDSNSNNLVDIYGDLTAEGKIETTKSIRIPKNSTAGYGLCNSDGTSIIRDYNNTHVTVNATGGTLFLGHATTNDIDFLNSKGKMYSDGSLYMPTGFYSKETGNVGTASGTGKLVIKKATSSEAPNNGVVLEFGNSTSWVGQLYIGDNADQGVYYNGWSNGTRGSWKKLAWEPVSLYDNSSGSNASISLSETSANFQFLEIFYRTNDNYRSSKKIYNANGKKVILDASVISGNYTYIKSAQYSISGTSISLESGLSGQARIGNNTATQWDKNSNRLYIEKVIGYRW